MGDNFSSAQPGLESPADDGLAVTPSDSVDLATDGRALYVGGTGDVALVTPKGTVLTFVGVPAGTILPVRVRRVNSTNTDATSMIALW